MHELGQVFGATMVTRGLGPPSLLLLPPPLPHFRAKWTLGLKWPNYVTVEISKCYETLRRAIDQQHSYNTRQYTY